MWLECPSMASRWAVVSESPTPPAPQKAYLATQYRNFLGAFAEVAKVKAEVVEVKAGLGSDGRTG